MGSFIAKQPNGLYCRFSTIVDCPTDWNMTKEDYIELCKKKAEEYLEKDAIYTIANCVKPFEMVREWFRPVNMTNEEFEALLTEMAKPVEKTPVKIVQYKYEVNIGGGCATGSVSVPETATDDEIRLAIMDDLYDVDYEKIEE